MKILAMIVGGIFGLLVGGAVVTVMGAIMALPVMFFWNISMPGIFKLPQISYFEAFGLYLLCSFLFMKLSNSSNSND